MTFQEAKLLSQLEECLSKYLFNNYIDPMVILTIFNMTYNGTSQLWKSPVLDIRCTYSPKINDPYPISQYIIRVDSRMDKIEVLAITPNIMATMTTFNNWIQRSLRYRKLDPVETLQSWILRVL